MAITYTYQWQRNFDSTGYAPIVGATSSTYALVAPTDEYCLVRCFVTATESTTGGEGYKLSNVLGPIDPAPYVPGSLVITYQWQRDDNGSNTAYSDIGGATSNTYALVDADDGCRVRCLVTGSTGGTTDVRTNSIGLVTEPIPVNSVAPAITGTLVVFQTISCSTGIWSHMAGYGGIYAYQWQRDVLGDSVYSNIGDNSNSSTFVLTSADDGAHLRCLVTPTNTGGTGSVATSNVVGLIVHPVPVNSVHPSVTGPTDLGETLVCLPGIWTSGLATTYAYQWKRSGTNIVGATNATRVIAAQDQGHYLTCVVTATSSGGTGTSTESNDRWIHAQSNPQTWILAAGFHLYPEAATVPGASAYPGDYLVSNPLGTRKPVRALLIGAAT